MDKEILEKLNSHDVVIGVDEVGRGPIAGPVTVAAFGITLDHLKEVREKLQTITDSKKLSEKKREAFVEVIRELKKEKKVYVTISSVAADVINEKGIVPSLKAAVISSLSLISKDFEKPYVYLDGSLHAPETFDQETIIKGDFKNWLIASASVVAKVTRDNLMVKYGKEYPEYGFENHKGYGTKAHYEAIEKEGMTNLHRRTWIRTKLT